MAEQSSQFNRLVLMALARLYTAHPRAVTLAPADIYPPELRDAADENLEAEAAGTILWLYRSGAIAGDLVTQPGISVALAQLSAPTYKKMISREPTQNVGQLGAAAVDYSEKPDNPSVQLFCKVLVSNLI